MTRKPRPPWLRLFLGLTLITATAIGAVRPTAAAAPDYSGSERMLGRHLFVSTDPEADSSDATAEGDPTATATPADSPTETADAATDDAETVADETTGDAGTEDAETDAASDDAEAPQPSATEEIAPDASAAPTSKADEGDQTPDAAVKADGARSQEAQSLAANTPPVVASDSYATSHDTPLTVDAANGVLRNDTDLDGDTLTVGGLGTSTHGTVSLNGNGAFTFTPETGFVGQAGFTYRATDGTDLSPEAPVLIQVTNATPRAQNQSFLAVEGIALTVAAPGVLLNAFDLEGDALTALLVDRAAHGKVALAADGGFTYTPDPGFTGDDAFTFQASDGLGLSTVATATIHVRARPTGVPDEYTVVVDGTLTVDADHGVLINDLFLGTATAALAGSPSHGTLTAFAPDGSFSYTPDTDFVGEDTFTYTASDDVSTSDETTVTITVAGAAGNRPPVALDDAYTVHAGTTLTVDAAHSVLANDSDPDNDPLHIASFIDPLHGSVALGLFDGSLTYTPNSGFVGDDQFTYSVSDGFHQPVAATVTITVTANQPPVAVDDSFTVAEDSTLTVAAPGLLANDSDADGDSVTLQLDAVALHGTVDLQDDGSFTYKPNAGFSGTDSFRYDLFDGIVNGNIATVTIEVTPINHAPVARNRSFATVQDVPLVFAAPGVLLSANDPDGDPMTALLADAPAHGTVDLAADGGFVYTPDAGFTGDDAFTYQASDGDLTSASGTITIQVRALPIGADDDFATAINTPLTVDAPGVLANDVDPAGDQLTAVISSPPSDGTIDFHADGSFTYTPDAGFVGIDFFFYLPTDPTFTGEQVEVSITVGSAPVGEPDSYTMEHGKTLTVDAASGVLANDLDPNGLPLTARVRVRTVHGDLNEFADGSFSYTPDSGFAGTDSFEYVPQNDGFEGDLTTVTIEVVDHPPVAVDDAYSTIAGVSLFDPAPGLLVNDTDADGDTLVVNFITGVTDPAHGFANVFADGRFSYSPDDGFVGTDSFTYTISDGVLTSEPATVTITVNPAPDDTPSATPTSDPTETATPEPTETATPDPTEEPTQEPTEAPTERPGETPTPDSTPAPTETATATAIPDPTEAPTETPVDPTDNTPSETPTAEPTQDPTQPPIASPTETATSDPTEEPTDGPTETPASEPSAPKAHADDPDATESPNAIADNTGAAQLPTTGSGSPQGRGSSPFPLLLLGVGLAAAAYVVRRQTKTR